MNTVPNVRLSDASLFILSRYARYTSPSLAGTTQLTNHEMYRISVELRRLMMKPVSRSSRCQRFPRSGNPR